MIKRFLLIFVFLLSAPIVAANAAAAFEGPGCMGDCTSCHTLTKDEAGKLLKVDRFKAEITDIKVSPVKGLWEVTVVKGNSTFPIYVDFAKKYLVEGRFTPLENLGEPISLKKVDVSKIPLDAALVLGDPKAPKKLIVFDDPECPYCAKLHPELKKIVEKRKDIAVYIKLFPLAIHPQAYEMSKAISCSGSVKMLDDAFAHKKLPKADCDAKEIDANIKLAEKLGIKGTPGIILPDGRLIPGYVPADALLELVDNPRP